MPARAVLNRIYVTSLLYQLTANSTWAARAVQELLGATTWAHWNIEHHALDTGELCHAFAIGLDWCYDYLTTRLFTLLGLFRSGGNFS